jgi:putative ABC transport system permease protein
MLFRWDYLDEALKKTPMPSGQVGWYVIQIANPQNAGTVSRNVDILFKNSLAETLTETEKAFQMGFVAMTEALVVAIRVVSFVVIAVILVILANTMAMTARERMSEYATLKTLGFGNWFITKLIAGESLTLALLGGVLGIGLSFPSAHLFSQKLGAILPVFHIQGKTLLLASVICWAIGLLAALFPVWRATRIKIVDALTHIG